MITQRYPVSLSRHKHCATPVSSKFPLSLRGIGASVEVRALGASCGETGKCATIKGNIKASLSMWLCRLWNPMKRLYDVRWRLSREQDDAGDSIWRRREVGSRKYAHPFAAERFRCAPQSGSCEHLRNGHSYPVRPRWSPGHARQHTRARICGYGGGRRLRGRLSEGRGSGGGGPKNYPRGVPLLPPGEGEHG